MAKDKARLQRHPLVLQGYENLKTNIGVTKFITDGQTGEVLMIAHYRGVVVAQATAIGRAALAVEAELLHAQLLDYVKHGRRQ
jgi:hypothetical protein